MPDADTGLPLVTIVTPTYNQASFLAETIESVLAQDYPNIEYIVLNDGSTDNTEAVLEPYKARIKVETHANMGQSQTLNKGWRMARGSLLGYLSSDDLLAPDAISTIVRAMRATPDAVVAYCDFDLIDAQGNHVKTVATPDYDESLLTERLVCLPGPGALFTREVFEATGGWNPGLAQTPDFSFWLEACLQGSFIRVPTSLAKYRMHEDSASFRPVSPARANEIINVVDAYWQRRGGSASTLPQAMARLIAARIHTNAGRIGDALRLVREAIALRPVLLFSPFVWRFLIAGLFRRLFYRQAFRLSK